MDLTDNLRTERKDDYGPACKFVDKLEEQEQLVRINTIRFSADLEITEIVDRVSKGPESQNKALLFENVPVMICLY